MYFGKCSINLKILKLMFLFCIQYKFPNSYVCKFWNFIFYNFCILYFHIFNDLINYLID